MNLSYRTRLWLCGCALVLCTASVQAQDKIRVAELSPQAETAIDKGLRYLARTQNNDGSWDKQNPVGVTSLTLMAYMVKGYFPEREPYGEVVGRGVKFLLTTARTGKGYMGNSMYDHGLATLALSEAWGESSLSDEVRDALRQAVAVIVKSQSPRGGWRYQPNGADQDISITVMQIIALASAKEAGILVPNETIDRAIAYVKWCQNPDGSFNYLGRGVPSSGLPGIILTNNPGGSYFARTAAGVISLQMAGERNSREAQLGLEYLTRLGTGPFNPHYPWFYYGQYYAVQAMYQAGEKEYLAWYPRVRDSLIASQHPDGSWTGGVPPNVKTIVLADRDSYCTPTAILVLGVPYRFLPIYQR